MGKTMEKLIVTNCASDTSMHAGIPAMLADSVQCILERLDRTFSLYSAESVLSRINASTDTNLVFIVPRDFYRVFQASKRISSLTMSTRERPRYWDSV